MILDYGLKREQRGPRCRYLQNVQDIVIHLEVDTKSSGISHKEVRGKASGYGPHVRCLVHGYQMLLMHNKHKQRSTRLDREPETEKYMVTNE